MDYWQLDKTSLLSRTSFILNKDLLSDVRFIVGSTNTEYPAHKLLLSLASPVFEQRFSEHESENVIRVPDIVPSAFHKMLQYIYTDTLMLDDQNDASNVLFAAEKYKIHHLQIQCQKYIQDRNIPPEKACKMYEAAMKLGMTSVLKYCKHTFVKHTKQVLQSDGFLRAQLSTVIAIIQNEELSADEKTILESVVKWGIAECERKEMHSSRTNIRSCIDNLMKYLRFLSLSVDEFSSFLEKYDILTKNELFCITMKLSQPSITISVPPAICQNISKRDHSLMPNSTIVLKQIHPSGGLHSSDISYADTEVSCSASVEGTTAKSSPIIHMPAFCVEETDDDFGSFSHKIHTPAVNLTKNKLYGPGKEEHILAHNNMYFHDTSCKKYSIPLFASDIMLAGFQTDDVSSTIRLKIRSGQIRLIGITVKFKDAQIDRPQQLPMLVRITTSQGENYEEVFSENASRQNRLSFNHIIKLQSSESVHIAVIVEGLQLQRCLVCDTHNFSYSGSDTSFSVALLSNQRMIKNQLPFLIGEILYSTK